MRKPDDELIKELFQLSGWLDSDETVGTDYSLGYLLSKLQERPKIYLEQLTGGKWHCYAKWSIMTELAKKIDPKILHLAMPPSAYTLESVSGYGSTPENAACMLAINLFKEGNLK
jgi:hypothetical protein